MLRAHGRRLAGFIVIGLIYLLLFSLNVRATLHISPHFAAVRIGGSTLISLLFLVVGVFVWFYAGNRWVSLVFFLLCSSAACNFVIETGAGSGDFLLSECASITTALSLGFLAALMLLFPRNLLVLQEGVYRSRHAYALRVYLCGLSAMGLTALGGSVLFYLRGLHDPEWLNTTSYVYVLIALVGSIVSVVICYKGAPSVRERQQLRLLLGGLASAILPFVVLTLLPMTLHLPPRLTLDSTFSTAPFVVLPLTLGYATLRYQLLVFDLHIRRATATLVGLFGLLSLAYVLVSAGFLMFKQNVSVEVGVVVVGLAVLGFPLWWVIHTQVERLFFSEILHFRHLLTRPERLSREHFDLDEVVRLIGTALVDFFDVQAACLIVLDEEAGCYRPYYPLKEKKQASQSLIKHVFASIPPVETQGKQTDWMDPAAIALLEEARRPLLLSELCQHKPVNLSYFLGTTRGSDHDPLFVPIRVNKKKMVGALILGSRGDRQAYAGPDYEAIDLIAALYTPLLETARLYGLDSSYASLVWKIYAGLPKESVSQYEEVAEAARAYAKIAASATSNGAEVWLVGGEDGGEQVLRKSTHVGTGPSLFAAQVLRVASLPAEARRSCFITRGHVPEWFADVDPVAGGEPANHGGPIPAAWLPLARGDRLIGLLLLTYARPHMFSEKEQRLWQLFAQQCSIAVEHAQMVYKQGVAYEQHVEFARVRDRLLLGAARDLRTPLATVGGYIDLVRAHGAPLGPGGRRELLVRAQQTCNELVLMVNTIIDASFTLPGNQRSLPALRTLPVPLMDTIGDIFKMRELMVRRQDRSVRISGLSTLHALADPLRLRQVVFNLLSYALAYSPAGGAIEVEALAQDREVIVRVACGGGEITRQEEERLFAPFVQLSGETETHVRARAAHLGLSTSKMLVEAMGGRIWIERAGSSLAFVLALRLADLGDTAPELPSVGEESKGALE